MRGESVSGRVWILLLVLAAGSTWISPFRRDLFVGDETKYGRILYELRESGQIRVLPLEGEPYAQKPPLHFWILLALASLFGLTSTWTFVLPSLAAFLLVCGLTALVARRIAECSGTVAAAIFGSFWLVWISAQTARMDLAFTACITAGALLIHESLEQRRRSALSFAGMAFGLAILLKGPMAALIAIALYVTERRLRRDRSSLGEPLVALLLMAAVPLLWLIPAAIAGGEGYLRELILVQSLGRAIDASVHAEPAWFYVLRFPLTFFPWFLLVIAAGWAWFRETGLDLRRRLRFLVVWFLAVFFPFSIISSKLDVYMLPAMVPVAALAAWSLQHGPVERRRSTPVAVTILLLGLLALAAALSLHFLSRQIVDPPLIHHPALPGLFWMVTGSSVLGLWVGRGFRHPSSRVAFYGILTLLPLLYLVTVLMPLVNEEASAVRLVRILSKAEVPPEEIGLYWTPHLWSRSMPEPMHRVRYDDPAELRHRPPAIVVVRQDHASDLGALLDRYERIDRVRLIGKEFDVYQQRESGSGGDLHRAR